MLFINIFFVAQSKIKRLTMSILTFNLVRGMRIELTRESHTPLKRTRLPVPPPAHHKLLDYFRKKLNKRQDYNDFLHDI